MGLFGKARDETELAENGLEESRSGFEGNLHLALPVLEDWKIEYHIDHNSANFTVEPHATFSSVWFSSEVDGEEREIPSYLRDWKGKYCNLMINCFPSAEDFEFRKTQGRLGEGWREPGDQFVIKIYLTRTEFRDVVSVLRQDHLRHSTASREVILGWLQQHDVDTTGELEDAFAPSAIPNIRIDVKNTRMAPPENILNAELIFDVCRIYA